ncbi:hypothetical protein HK097_001748 [Rhizophlyctis rosea]|uniref:Mediator of RNA polymerase II transcription subunit 31 n=1 Tax=Rhizophlyctis rosea TaxID=64517 RepID=A0AAD5S538_9FUNG|nr:hypothetical protein HK097_001748 [Rhizophlyctis rosea]
MPEPNQDPPQQQTQGDQSEPQSNTQPPNGTQRELTAEEAAKMYEENMELEYEKREGGASPPDLPKEPPSHASRRFQIELEFVQSLANPEYLKFLAENRYFEQPGFIPYLQYLTYWQTPKYAKYICYPYALQILSLLQHQSFRDACAHPDALRILAEREFNHWKYYRAKRIPGGHEKVADESLFVEEDPMEIVSG